MITKKGAAIAITVILIIIFALLAASLRERNRIRGEFAEHIIARGAGRWERPDAINELRRSIAAYERRIARHVETAARTANYWKLLGIRLQQRGLHGEALEAFERAIFLAPEDPTIHHFTGISAAITAKSFHVFPGRDIADRVFYFSLAEESFLRAIDLDDRYLRPRYSLGVLYVFDLDRPLEAIPHLQRVLEISRGDMDTMFVLARAFYMIEDFRPAVDLFDRIITLTRDDQTRLNAQNNREAVMRRMHGW